MRRRVDERLGFRERVDRVLIAAVVEGLRSVGRELSRCCALVVRLRAGNARRRQESRVYDPCEHDGRKPA